MSCCHPISEIPVQYSAHDGQAVLYSRLLYPFVDVFCFYVHNLRELPKIAEHLALWMKNNHPEIRPDSRPQLLIVLDGSSGERTNDSHAEEFESLLAANTTHTLSGHFSEVEFVQPNERYNIQDCLRQKAKAVQDKRRLSGLLFSVQHVNCLFDRLFEGIECLPTSYIQAARQDFPVKRDMETHIANFLDLIPSATELRTFGAEVVASSILLDNYPPGMHGKTVKLPTNLILTQT